MNIKPNNIYLGDCYELIKEIPDKSIDLIYVDIPYLIDSHGYGKSDLSKRLVQKDKQLGRAKFIYNENKKENNRINMNAKKKDLEIVDITAGIDYSIFDEYIRVMKKLNLYVWCSKHQILDILNYFSKHGNYEVLVWCKTNPMPTTNNLWLPDIEYCLYFREKGVKLNNGYELKSKFYVSPANVDDKKKYKHPTIKPIELVKKHILHTTQRGGLC